MKIYVVGDSTLAKFNDLYFYPRYGYATMLNHFFKDDVTIINNALSGRSSRSYILDPEYKKTFDELNKGDYLLIGFGHNDEKDDDFLRFSDASLPIDNKLSFKYSIYNNYVLPAINKGAIPIISTPVVRLSKNNNYTGNIIHDTIHGNYRDALIELGKEKNITVIDLTNPTKELYEKIGYDKAIYHHAMTSGIKKDGKVVADPSSVDKTHLNYYGAKYSAYLFSLGLKNTNSELKKYLKDEINAPTDADLFMDPKYEFVEYHKPDLSKYNPGDNFKTTTKDIYGTAIGAFENPMDLYAYEDNNKFIVGTKTLNGRTVATCDSDCFVFKEVDANLNFKISANAKIISFLNTRQSAFGLKLRDDIYINYNYKRVSASNYVSAGFITADASTNIIYSRSSTTELNKEPNVINEFYKTGDTAYLEIERLGQRITVKVIFRGKEYTKYYFDFDLTKIDNKSMYIGLYASKGVLVEFSDVNFIITGEAKGA